MTLTYTDGEPVQVGDRVTVEGVVAQVGAVVVIQVEHRTWTINPHDIASHSSPPIKAGDKVRWLGADVIYEVVHIHEGRAWIWTYGAGYLRPLSELQRVSP